MAEDKIEALRRERSRLLRPGQLPVQAKRILYWCGLRT